MKWPWETKRELREALIETRDELKYAKSDLISAQTYIRKMEENIAWVIEARTQPIRDTEACGKVILHTHIEAEAFIKVISERLHIPADEFLFYKCRICPRHPVTSARIYHIANKRPKDRSGTDSRRDEVNTRMRGNRNNLVLPLSDKVTPATLARLRADGKIK